MGVTLNGSGYGGGASSPVITGTLTIKNTNNASEHIASAGRSSKQTKKKLNYNYREISGQLLRAKKAQGAASVLARAKSKLGFLQRCASSEKYDHSQVANAIAHAKKMVECAQLKTRNLRQEEQERKKHSKDDTDNERKTKNEVKRRAASKEKELEQKVSIEEIQKVQQEKTERQQMLKKRSLHRQQELGKVNEADMKYLKKEIEDGRYLSGSSAPVNSNVILELSPQATALSEAQLELKAKQQAELEVTTEGAVAVEGIECDGTGTSLGCVLAGPKTVETPAVVDVSV